MDTLQPKVEKQGVKSLAQTIQREGSVIKAIKQFSYLQIYECTL